MTKKWCDSATLGVLSGGNEALSAMEQHPFDVVLLDLRMPDLDGMDVLKIVKERWPDCEVVVITGYPSIESAKEAVRLGAYDYLAKPLGPDEVIKAANDAVTQKRWALRSDRQNREAEDLVTRPLTNQSVTHLTRSGGTS
jgi:DNA-binding NtrC family response regulator